MTFAYTEMSKADAVPALRELTVQSTSDKDGNFMTEKHENL